jgi:hypothetical protein
MKITHKRCAALAAVPVAAVLLAGCGSFASSHDNARVNYEIKDGQTTVVSAPGPVTRIDTPGNFPAVVRVCVGTEGVYVAGDGGSSTFVVTYDPGCGYKGSR